MLIEILDYFFDDDDLHFRALIVPDKKILQHEQHDQSHDDWYFKMYFDMLKVILYPHSRYRIFLDIKDTRSRHKIVKLHDVLCTAMYDFDKKIIDLLQVIRSHESELLQLTDLLIGIISYINRNLNTSEAKVALVNRMKDRSGYSLTHTTLLREDKVNLFVWHPREIL